MALTGPGQPPALSTVMFRIGSHVSRRTPLSTTATRVCRTHGEPAIGRRLKITGKKKNRRRPGGEYDGLPRGKKRGETKATQGAGAGSEKKLGFSPPPLAWLVRRGWRLPGWTLPGRRAHHRSRSARRRLARRRPRPGPVAVAAAAGTGTGELSSCCLQASLHMWIPRKGRPGRPWPYLDRMFPWSLSKILRIMLLALVGIVGILGTKVFSEV